MMDEPLNSWLPKGGESDMVRSPDEQKQAFQALKQSLVEHSVLVLPEAKHPFLLDTDSSTYQIGVTVPQKRKTTTQLTGGKLAIGPAR